jgi:hypothetical protein
MRPSSAAWIDAVRAAESGPALLTFLTNRLARPHEDGPALDDLRGEGPEEVFEALARQDEAFRLRLEETIAAYFKRSESSPARDEARPVIRGMLEIVSHLCLPGAFTPLRAWLQQHAPTLAADADAVLGRTALAALATSQLPGVTEERDFWLRWWRDGPPAWQPRAFHGLRLHDPKAAARELPLLMQRAAEQNHDPGPLLQGMWLQPGARPALLAWLNDTSNEWAETVKKALRKRLPEAELDQLRSPLKPPQRALRRRSDPG